MLMHAAVLAALLPRSQATSWFVVFLASLILLNLVGIFLHVITLRDHLSSLPSVRHHHRLFRQST